MKENVDLTENSDFRFKAKDFFYNYRTNNTRSYVDQETAQYLHDAVFDRFDVFKDKIFIDNDKGAILQGNATERKEKLKMMEFCDGKTCDCCGAPLWVYNNETLCENCQEMIYMLVNIHSNLRDNFL